MKTLAEIRAQLKAQEEKASNPNQNFNGPSEFLAHWNIPEGSPLNLRFLPDGNPNNDYFWRERETITMTFKGVKGGESKDVKVTVPCMEMFDGVGSCPVHRDLREWFKAGDQYLEERAREYWKKKSYLLQCFVGPNSCAVEGDVQPENPVRRVILNKNLFNKVKSILLNPNIEFMPTDYDRGRDFSIIKGKQGKFANYDQSQWSFAERPLLDRELEAVKQFGLFDLEEFNPKKPTPEGLTAIYEMFEASVNGEQYDFARWGEFYRPGGVQAPVGTVPTAPKVEEKAQQEVHTPAVEHQVLQQEVHTPVEAKPEPVKTTPTKSSTSDLLAKLKAAKGE